jgi:hypothetical protein
MLEVSRASVCYSAHVERMGFAPMWMSSRFRARLFRPSKLCVEGSSVTASASNSHPKSTIHVTNRCLGMKQRLKHDVAGHQAILTLFHNCSLT